MSDQEPGDFTNFEIMQELATTKDCDVLAPVVEILNAFAEDRIEENGIHDLPNPALHAALEFEQQLAARRSELAERSEANDNR